MEIYRLVRSEYKDDLSGNGAFLYGGRWNNKGVYALYAASHISLAVLEIVVNLDRAVLGFITPLSFADDRCSGFLDLPF